MKHTETKLQMLDTQCPNCRLPGFNQWTPCKQCGLTVEQLEAWADADALDRQLAEDTETAADIAAQDEQRGSGVVGMVMLLVLVVFIAILYCAGLTILKLAGVI